ncbi:MAG TPA: hypothetical protein VGL94_00205 [Ktedonobacteraceae bacterium]|jgi:hypothetical protein
MARKNATFDEQEKDLSVWNCLLKHESSVQQRQGGKYPTALGYQRPSPASISDGFGACIH